MKKVVFTVVLLSMLLSVSVDIIAKDWRDFDVRESVISDDYAPQKNMVLVVAKIISNIDIKEYFISKKFTNASAYERSSLNSLAFLFLDITGKSKGAEVKPLFFSWEDYFIMEIPIGNYKLHSMLYPPNSRNNMYKFEFNDFLDFEFSMNTPFVYIGDIQLLFGVENEFGVTEHRLLIQDNYLEAKGFLSDRIKDPNGKYLIPEKALPENNKSLVFDIKRGM